MLIVPAIDIRGGKCVRLVQGDYDRETVFGDEPADMARRWLAEGASALHLVDLDGARDGSSENHAAVERILQAVASGADDQAPPVTELGGGIRDAAGARRWLEAGIDRVILGTVAVASPEIVDEVSGLFPGRVWVGIDARDGKVAVAGWTETTDTDAVELARDVERRGAAGIIYTDIARDGTGGGVNVDATAAVADAVTVPVFASGGVHSTDDVRRLRAVEGRGVAGVIVGRALYDGSVSLAGLLAEAGS